MRFTPTILCFPHMKKHMNFFSSTLIVAALIASTLFLASCTETAKAPSIDNTNPANGAVSGDTANSAKTETTKIDSFSTEQTPSSNSQTMTSAANDNSQLAPPKAGDKVVTLETSMGTIKFKLFTAQVPEMTKNFETLAAQGKYTNVPFHRVIQDFMIQTGDFTNQNGSGGYSYKGPGTELKDEIVPGLKHLFGTVAMANSGPDTNGSQFYIVTNKNGTPYLDGNYTIFGQVYEGMDVALQIAALQTPGGEQPTKEVLVKTATVETLK